MVLPQFFIEFLLRLWGKERGGGGERETHIDSKLCGGNWKSVW